MDVQRVTPAIVSPFFADIRHGIALWIARVTVFTLAALFGWFGFSVVGPFVTHL